MQTSRWEMRGEKQLVLWWYTCKVYILHSPWRYVVLYSCDNVVIYDRCLLIQCMWLMQPLSGAIQFVMDQSQIDPVYRLKGRMLGSLMSDSRWPVGPVISLQFNRVDLSNRWVPLSLCMVWSWRILTPSKPSSRPNGLEWEENGCDAEDTQNIVSSWP